MIEYTYQINSREGFFIASGVVCANDRKEAVKLLKIQYPGNVVVACRSRRGGLR